MLYRYKKRMFPLNKCTFIMIYTVINKRTPKCFLFKLHDKKDIAGYHVSAMFFKRFYNATEQNNTFSSNIFISEKI